MILEVMNGISQTVGRLMATWVGYSVFSTPWPARNRDGLMDNWKDKKSTFVAVIGQGLRF